jgi:sugar-phosphatase
MNARGLVESAEALLVDLDGTLVDSTAPVHRAWSEFAARHGLDPEHVHRFAPGRPSRESVRLLAPGANHVAEADALERAELGDSGRIIALPGASELLSGRWRLAIVTRPARECSPCARRILMTSSATPTRSSMT